jgi:hypothetical protein
VVCGYTKGKDGKVINEGSDTFLAPVPVPTPASSSLPFTRQITPKAANNNLKSTDKDNKSKTLLSKRKDTAHDDYEEEDIDELENDNDDDDDDEDADDSVAFSKYVHARMKESEKPSKVANFGSEKQYKVNSAGTKKIALSSGSDTRTQLAKTEKVLANLLAVRFYLHLHHFFHHIHTKNEFVDVFVLQNSILHSFYLYTTIFLFHCFILIQIIFIQFFRKLNTVESY